MSLDSEAEKDKNKSLGCSVEKRTSVGTWGKEEIYKPS